MNKNKKRRYNKLKLIFNLSLIVFTILTVSYLCVFAFYMIAHRLPWIDVKRFPPHTEQYILGIISLVIGIILSALFRKLIVNPLNEVFGAIDDISQGNYNIKLSPKGIKPIKQIDTKLNKTAYELKSIETMRDDFVDNFSHEFKTPIISISGFAKILKNENLTKEEYNEYLNIIINESERLAKLSTNVLNLSRLDNQVILSGIKQFNVSEQIRLAVVLLEQKIEEKNITISMEGNEHFISGNEETLKQLWINLIDNAIKYSPHGAEIIIKTKSENEEFVFTVSDRGKGMDEETKKHAFERFYQGDVSHKAFGNGIGLTIAKKICELHNGTIAIKSTGENGTVFEVRLPL